MAIGPDLLFTLVLEWAKQRRAAAASADLKDFQDWVRHEMTPVLLSTTEATLQAVIGLRAVDKARYEHIVALLTELRELVTPLSKADEIAQDLTDADRAVLVALLRLQDPERPHVAAEAIAEATRLSLDDVSRSFRFLGEKHLVVAPRIAPAQVRLSAEGVDLAWALTDAARRLAIHGQLRRLLVEQRAARIGSLVEATQASEPLVRAVIAKWAARGLVRFESGWSPPSHDRVDQPTEAFQRAELQNLL